MSQEENIKKPEIKFSREEKATKVGRFLDRDNQFPRHFLPVTFSSFNPLSANITKWSNTLKQFVGSLWDWRLKC